MYGINSKWDYIENGREKNWIGNNTNVTPEELFKLVTLDRADLFKDIKVRYLNADSKNTTYVRLNGEDLLESEFTEKRHRTFGRCYSWHPTVEQKKLGIYYISVRM